MKASLPQGTRDFAPDTVRRRQYILNTIKDVFELYGFQPLETPAMENLETLLGKYGEEGDKLIFKILNNGLNDPKNNEKAKIAFEQVINGKNDKNLTERALRYDLTIPFARYVAMNHGQISFPFRRYQMQPVWRADRPQKGRYREFYQCDADIVGSYSLWNEVDFMYMYHEVFYRLGLKKCVLHINSRKILTALAELCGGPEKMMDITIAIDKLDKIGLEKVNGELRSKGLSNDQLTIVNNYLNITGSNEAKLKSIMELFHDSPIAKNGIDEINFLLQHNSPDFTTQVSIDQTLARGLNYYTGIIFEAKAPAEVKIGSISGGGRYDDLTGLFGVPDIPGVGISFGIDRIYDVLEELNLFPEKIEKGSKVLFFNLGDEESKVAYSLLIQLRRKGIPSEMYHEPARFDKQFKYAGKKKIDYIIIIGSKEIERNECVIKDIRSGEQKTVSFSNLSNFLFI